MLSRIHRSMHTNEPHKHSILSFEMTYLTLFLALAPPVFDNC